MKTQTHKHTSNPFIEKRPRSGGFYAILRAYRGDKGFYLGKLPADSPTPLLDLALKSAQKMDLYSLRKLLAANKSSREL